MAGFRLSAERARALAGSLIFLVIAPGTVAGFFPWVISRWQFHPFSGEAALRPLGIVLTAAATAVLLEAFIRFALQGLGTPAPIYPTRRLIVQGSYRFVRNPMYLAVEAVILGQAALFGSIDLVIYAAMIAVAFLSVRGVGGGAGVAAQLSRGLSPLRGQRPALSAAADPVEARPVNQKPPPAKSAARDKRLAAALRQNLRRRKTADRPAEARPKPVGK
jgi:protein-S-isoprenylcysteine O-methyltransferase Ste14